MADTPKITADDVRHVASLAHLELSSEEESGLQRDLSAILGHIAQLNEVDTASVPPMAQVAEVLEQQPRNSSALRSDTLRPSLERDAVMRSTPETDGAFFKVPKVIER